MGPPAAELLGDTDRNGQLLSGSIAAWELLTGKASEETVDARDQRHPTDRKAGWQFCDHHTEEEGEEGGADWRLPAKGAGGSRLLS